MVAEQGRARAVKLSQTFQLRHATQQHVLALAAAAVCQPDASHAGTGTTTGSSPGEAAAATAAHLTHRRQVFSGRLGAARVGPTRPNVVSPQAAGMRCGGALPGWPLLACAVEAYAPSGPLPTTVTPFLQQPAGG